MSAVYCIHAITWEGIALQVRWCPNWCNIIAHLEIQSDNDVPLPITETGYRSHFIHAEHIEAEGGPVAYALAWLEHEGSKSGRQSQRDALRQLSLF